MSFSRRKFSIVKPVSRITEEGPSKLRFYPDWKLRPSPVERVDWLEAYVTSCQLLGSFDCESVNFLDRKGEGIKLV